MQPGATRHDGATDRGIGGDSTGGQACSRRARQPGDVVLGERVGEELRVAEPGVGGPHVRHRGRPPSRPDQTSTRTAFARFYLIAVSATVMPMVRLRVAGGLRWLPAAAGLAVLAAILGFVGFIVWRIAIKDPGHFLLAAAIVLLVLLLLLAPPALRHARRDDAGPGDTPAAGSKPDAPRGRP
jgi:hypothetical protein